MNFEEITAIIAEWVNDYLPADNPWKGNVTANVADPKDTYNAEGSGNTWAVVQVNGGAREIVPGNATMQADCRVYAQVVPTEGGWTAADITRFANELGGALVRAADELMVPVNEAATDWVILGVHVNGGATMSAERGVGYSVEQPFLLTVQF